MHNREITHIVKTEFIKNSIDCKEQMFILLPFERNICQNLKKPAKFYLKNNNAKARFETLKIQVL